MRLLKVTGKGLQKTLALEDSLVLPIQQVVVSLGGTAEEIPGVYLALVPRHWARSEVSAEEALRLAKKKAGVEGRNIPHVVYLCEDQEAYCDEARGLLCFKTGTLVVKVEEYEPKLSLVK